MCNEMWVASWQNQRNDCAPSEDSEQPGHPPSLIRAFTVLMKKPWVLSYPLSAQRRLWSDWADARTDLSLSWVHSHFVGFVMLRLIYKCTQICVRNYSCAQTDLIYKINWNIRTTLRLKSNQLYKLTSEGSSVEEGPPIAPSTECGDWGSDAPRPDSTSSSFSSIEWKWLWWENL